MYITALLDNSILWDDCMKFIMKYDVKISDFISKFNIAFNMILLESKMPNVSQTIISTSEIQNKDFATHLLDDFNNNFR